MGMYLEVMSQSATLKVGGEAEEKVLVIQKSQTFVCDSCRGILVTVIELFILITSDQLGRVFVAQIGAQLVFQGQWSRGHDNRNT